MRPSFRHTLTFSRRLTGAPDDYCAKSISKGEQKRKRREGVNWMHPHFTLLSVQYTFQRDNNARHPFPGVLALQWRWLTKFLARLNWTRRCGTRTLKSCAGTFGTCTGTWGDKVGLTPRLAKMKPVAGGNSIQVWGVRGRRAPKYPPQSLPLSPLVFGRNLLWLSLFVPRGYPLVRSPVRMIIIHISVNHFYTSKLN